MKEARVTASSLQSKKLMKFRDRMEIRIAFSIKLWTNRMNPCRSSPNKLIPLKKAPSHRKIEKSPTLKFTNKVTKQLIPLRKARSQIYPIQENRLFLAKKMKKIMKKTPITKKKQRR